MNDKHTSRLKAESGFKVDLQAMKNFQQDFNSVTIYIKPEGEFEKTANEVKRSLSEIISTAEKDSKDFAIIPSDDIKFLKTTQVMNHLSAKNDAFFAELIGDLKLIDQTFAKSQNPELNKNSSPEAPKDNLSLSMTIPLLELHRNMAVSIRECRKAINIIKDQLIERSVEQSKGNSP